METRGRLREANLPRSAYFSDSYFRLEQLFAFAHQVHQVYCMVPESVIEIGIGNGFTSTFLKRAGFNVVTVDINPELEPDICAPISELQERLKGRHFDLVVCCEVLEHMPFDEFVQNIRIFSAIGNRLYLTLPSYRTAFGFGGFIRLPKLPRSLVNWYVEIAWKWNRKPLAEEHFWEIGSGPETEQRRLVNILGRYYENVTVDRLALNPYHVSFLCETSLHNSAKE